MSLVTWIISAVFLAFTLYKHRATHERCPETLLALFGAFVALRVEGDPSAFITEEYPLPGFGGRFVHQRSFALGLDFCLERLLSRVRSFCFLLSRSSLRLFSSSCFSTEGLRPLGSSLRGEFSLHSFELLLDGVSFFLNPRRDCHSSYP